MPDLTTIRTALAGQISAVTGLRSQAEVRDQVSPPVALVLPGNPLITYGATLDGAVTITLAVLLLLSDAAPSEKVQRALDVYLGIGSGEGESIAGAIMTDVSLGGVVEWCIPKMVTSYNHVEYNNIQYFGARMNVEIGAH
jgi:hypothetical protein